MVAWIEGAETPPSQMAAWLDHFTTWRDAFATWLDHWQTLAAGLVAIVAAVIAVSVPECFERRRARQEVEALRESLAGEIRLYVDLLIKAREILKTPKVEIGFLSAPLEVRSNQRDLRDLAMLPPPTVYPAAASKLGLISRPRAADVVGFYATIERLNFTMRAITNEPTQIVTVTNYLTLIDRFEYVCRRSLWLLGELPFDERDAEFRAKIEAMDAEAHAVAESTMRAHKAQRGNGQPGA